MPTRRISWWMALVLMSAVVVRTSEAAPDLPAPLHKARDMLGQTVEDRDGKNVGRLKEVVLEAGTGTVAFAVLAAGGVAGLGEQLFMVPWDVLQQPIRPKTMRLRLTADQLTGAPTFEEAKWPDMEDRHWTDAVHVYYGTYGKRPAVGKELPPQTAADARGGHVPQRFLRASAVLQGTVANPRGQRLGEIQDIVMDTAAGKVTYVALGFGGMLGLGDKLIAVPWPDLRESAGLGTFTLDVDKDTLHKAPGFDKDQWPHTAESLKR